MWKTEDNKIIKYLNRALLMGMEIEEIRLKDGDLYLVRKTNRDYNLYIPKEIKHIGKVGKGLRFVRGKLNAIGGENLENIDGLFLAIELDTLDLSKMCTDKCESMQELFMFASIKEIILGENWNTSKVKTMYRMFSNLNAEDDGVIDLDLNNWNMENIEDLSCMFYIGAFKTLKINKWKLKDKVNVIDIFKYMQVNTLDLTGMNLRRLNLNRNDHFQSMEVMHDTIKEIIVDKKDFKDDRVRLFIYNLRSGAKIITK